MFSAQPADVLAPGVVRSRLAPGGKDGPRYVVRDGDQPGGVTWTELWSLGRLEDEWRVTIPDIRMAANQVWPAHWHDCWTAIVVLDGTLMVGDWWMSRGDVLIAEPSVEYGPLLNGPHGCQLLEIFARDILSPGGYAPEYRDHPTLVYLQGVDNIAFGPRPPGSEGNAGRQCVRCEGNPGIHKGHLDGTAYYDLGHADDPSRAVLRDRRVESGRERPATAHDDDWAALVLDGIVRVGDQELVSDDIVIVERDREVPTMRAGVDGVHLLEIARTAVGARPGDGGWR
jgi:hypothetical protein